MGGRKLRIKAFCVSHLPQNRILLCHLSTWWQICAVIFPALEQTEKLWITNISGMWWNKLSNSRKFCQLPSLSVTPACTLCCPLEGFEVRFESNPERADSIWRHSSSMTKTTQIFCDKIHTEQHLVCDQ